MKAVVPGSGCQVKRKIFVAHGRVRGIVVRFRWIGLKFHHRLTILVLILYVIPDQLESEFHHSGDWILFWTGSPCITSDGSV